VIRRGLALLLIVGGLLAGETTAATASAPGRRTLTGSIDGAQYLIEVPRRWNGTLMLFSHPYYIEGMEMGIGLANRPETEKWLLDHGYALAASDFTGRYGFAVEQGMKDQIALLDFFTENVGTPRRTIATGSSMGAGISTLLVERYPQRFAGAAAMCGPLDLYGTWNLLLDVNFAVKTLLTEPGQEIDLVRPRDPQASTDALLRAVEKAQTTPEGKAKLALAGAIGNVTSWNSAVQPRPTELATRLQQQADVIMGAHVYTFGPNARADLERRAGGNPSWNVGVDYTRQLARSTERDLVRQAYQAAPGASLHADLAALAVAPRIAPDPHAVSYMYRNIVARGTAPTPVITLHNTGDGGALPENERWYASRVSDPNRLRQIYANRGGHCAFTAAEEIVVLRSLLTRIDTGHWAGTSPGRLNTEAGYFGPEYQKVYDYPHGDAAAVPSFVEFQPSNHPRPTP
jgi:pimeloyl-ACP methyl ester carboxylesterase